MLYGNLGLLLPQPLPLHPDLTLSPEIKEALPCEIEAWVRWSEREITVEKERHVGTFTADHKDPINRSRSLDDSCDLIHARLHGEIEVEEEIGSCGIGTCAYWSHDKRLRWARLQEEYVNRLQTQGYQVSVPYCTVSLFKRLNPDTYSGS